MAFLEGIFCNFRGEEPEESGEDEGQSRHEVADGRSKRRRA